MSYSIACLRTRSGLRSGRQHTSYNVIGDALALAALCGCFVALVMAVFKFGGTCVSWADDLPISLTATICGATVSVPVAGCCFLTHRLWQDIERFEKDVLS
ncbi:hypothetical protein DIPPA_04827 [Diplonema papillatum]|nr:hypothetical protein DIPPA_04827 [Diplonema papillatum]